MLSTVQYFRWGMQNLDIVQAIGDAAADFFAVDPNAPDAVQQRWEILKPVGDRLAPAADDLRALGAVRVTDGEQELEATLLDALNNQPSARADRPQRDGKWLQTSFQLLQVVLPVLLQLAK